MEMISQLNYYAYIHIQHSAALYEYLCYKSNVTSTFPLRAKHLTVNPLRLKLNELNTCTECTTINIVLLLVLLFRIADRGVFAVIIDILKGR